MIQSRKLWVKEGKGGKIYIRDEREEEDVEKI